MSSKQNKKELQELKDAVNGINEKLDMLTKAVEEIAKMQKDTKYNTNVIINDLRAIERQVSYIYRCTD